MPRCTVRIPHGMRYPILHVCVLTLFKHLGRVYLCSTLQGQAGSARLYPDLSTGWALSMGLLHLGRRRRRRTRGADERWQEIPFSVPVLCIRQLLLLGITLWAACPLPVASLTAATVQPAIRQFLVRS